MKAQIRTDLLILSLLFFLPQDSFSNEPARDCTYAREYITTLEYLRSHQDFILAENDARKVAEKVSQGCTGAAQRFIQVSSLLKHTGASAKDALATGEEFSARTDQDAKSFVAIFLGSFLPDSLDLDISTSLALARSLTAQLSAELPEARKDFEKLAQFCLDSKELGLPKPACGPFAAKIARKGEKFKGGVAKSFIDLFHYMISSKGPHLITGQALELSESLLDGGQNSVDNFILAFKYGISSHGLGIDTQNAIHFAREMALPKQVDQNLKERTNSGS